MPRSSILATFTSEELEWANAHDWTICASKDAVMVNQVSVTNINGSQRITQERKMFTSYKALREWAGY